jgi:hypothetical protein
VDGPADLRHVADLEPAALRDEFLAWGAGQGLAPDILAQRWLVVTSAERWLARHRLPLVAAQRSDIDAWHASREGRVKGEKGLEAIRTFIRFLEAMGYRGRKALQAPEDDAQVLDMEAHRTQRAG